MTNEEAIKIINNMPNYKPWEVEALAMAIKALESHRYKPIILQEHDAEPRTMQAIIDTETEEIYVYKFAIEYAERVGMTIEEG